MNWYQSDVDAAARQGTSCCVFVRKLLKCFRLVSLTFLFFKLSWILQKKEEKKGDDNKLGVAHWQNGEEVGEWKYKVDQCCDK